MAFGRATGIGPGSNTPTPVRGTGDAERLSSHRADDKGPSDGSNEFERSLIKRPEDYRGSIRVRPKGNRVKSRSVR